MQPPADCVTVNVPAEVTVFEDDVDPFDQSKFEPVAVKTEFPQLFTTLTAGALGAVASTNKVLRTLELHPLLKVIE